MTEILSWTKLEKSKALGGAHNDLAVEAIQTAAMARKGILSSYQKGDPAHGETTEN